VSISGPFIARPVATWLVAAALLVVGIIAYNQLPIAALPEVDFPTLQVSASLPGASPETMASNVATPLERQFSLIAGITEMTSANTLGQTAILLQFELSRNIDGAAQDVQAAINAAGGQLPTNLPAPPNVRKVNPADAPIMILVMTSDTLPLTQISDYADNLLAQQISRIDGIGQVYIGGAQKPAVRIQIDPRKVAALGLQLEAVRAQITANTVNLPKGTLTGPLQSFTIYANDQVVDAGIWNQMIVGYHNGAPVRVSDLGHAVQDVENNQQVSYTFPGKASLDPSLKAGKAILLAVFKQPGANVIQTVERVKAALPLLQTSMPPAITVHLVADRTQTIRASVKDVEISLLITIGLVIAVIFLFLRNVRATLIPSAVLPLSLLTAAALVLPLGFSLDNLSLMALSIAAGFVVDDAIVMLDVIWRRIEHGQSPLSAAVNGARDVSFTILSISISLIAVFTPVMFMGGVVGRFMREFAVTLSAAVIMSIIFSLTLTPMLCGQYLKPPQPSPNRFMLALERGFKALESAYAHGLDRVMRHMRLTLAGFLATAALTVILYLLVPTGFFPQQDTAFLNGVTVTSQDASFAKTSEKVVEVGRIIANDPDVEEVHFNLGGGSVNQSNFNVALTSRDSGRSATADQIIDRLRPQLAGVVGAQTILQASQDINIGARQAKAQYQYTLSDASLEELNLWAPKMLSAMQQMGQLQDVSTDQQSQAAAVNLTIDRDAAGRFGVSPADIDAAIYDQIGQHQVAQYFTQLNAYHVIVEAPPDLQTNADLFDSIYLLSPITGKRVPLSLFVKVDATAQSSLSIGHQGQLPAVTLSFNLSPGIALGQVTTLIEQARAKLGAPATLSGAFQGTAQAFQQSLADEPILILAALLSVYVILGVLYESYIHPLTILSTLPSAGLGALIAMIVAGQDLNVIGIIALILLIGIVKKNGIMIVDVALKLERDEGLSPEAAVVEASHQRLRPILMTTACAFLGGMPMIFSLGTGSEFRQPLGIAIVGGLIVSQALTLFTTPVIYVYLDRLRRRFEKDPVHEVSAREHDMAARTAGDEPPSLSASVVD
jgi:hydrophobe/amphiphile efflux-1 (HAE1) family protein